MTAYYDRPFSGEELYIAWALEAALSSGENQRSWFDLPESEKRAWESVASLIAGQGS